MRKDALALLGYLVRFNQVEEVTARWSQGRSGSNNLTGGVDRGLQKLSRFAMSRSLSK